MIITMMMVMILVMIIILVIMIMIMIMVLVVEARKMTNTYLDYLLVIPLLFYFLLL